MANQHIIDYINEEKTKGVSDDVIIQSLISAGWQTTDISEAFLAVPNPAQELVASDVPTPAITAETAATMPGAMDLIREAIEIFKAHWLQYVGFALLPTIFSFIMGIITVATPGFATLANNQGSASILDLFGPFTLIMLGISLVGGFLSLWASAATMVRIRDREETISFLDIMSRSLKYVIPMFIVSLLMGLITTGGFLLLIIPGIIFSLWFVFGIQVVIFDDERGINALLKSKGYISGNVCVVFGRWFVIVLIYFSVLIGYVFVSGIILNSIPDSDLSKTVRAIIQTPLNAIITILTTIIGVVIFNHIKKTKPNLTVESKGSTNAGLIAVSIVGLIATVGAFGIMVWAATQAPIFMENALDSVDSSSVTYSDVNDATDESMDTIFTPLEDAQFDIEFYKIFEGSYPTTLEQMIPDYSTAENIKGMTYTLSSDGSDYELCNSDGDCLTSSDF